MPELLGGHYEPLKRRSICETFETVEIGLFGSIDLLLPSGKWEELERWLARQGNLVSERGRPTVLKNCRIRFEWDD